MFEYYRPKEISWLSFNERVLQQAANKNVPLIERIKFLAIYSSNLDEFFRIRVATLMRLTKLGEKALEIVGHNPVETVKEINKIIAKQNEFYEQTRISIKKELKKNRVEIVNETEISISEKKVLLDFFRNELKKSLMPIILYDKKNVPDLIDDNIYLAIEITLKKEKEKIYSILQLPTYKFNRFIILPKTDNCTRLIYLDDVVRLGLKELFFFFECEKIEAYAFKMTKDAELDIEDDISATYLELVNKSLKKRKKGAPLRFNYDKNMSKDTFNYLTKLLKIGKVDSVLPGGRYHNTKDFIKFPNVLGEKFIYPKMPQIPIKKIERQHSYFDTLKNSDILLCYPYHSFNYYIDFLKEASVDKDVESIKITLYRLSKDSDVISALLNAARNGKRVLVILELQARFDEEANVKWSQTLTDGGVKVIHGVQGLKVHSKLTLVKRIENNKAKYYATIGTGNFNESTAKLYTDFSLMTANDLIARDVVNIFEFFKFNFKHFSYKHLIVSPFNSRRIFEELIDNEINNAKNGKKAFIHIKINNIDDSRIIQKLVEASQIGVEVILLVRGMFSLITEIPDVSDKIVARGIIDRYLEHSRFMIFCNNNNPRYFISSADWMVRNIDRRIEVATPIYDIEIQKMLRNIFEILLNDNVSSRVLDKNLTNKMYKNKKKKTQAQLEVFNYLSNLKI